jgi:acyl dehydratase
MIFWDALTVGEQHTLGEYTFHAEDILRFARAYDPQPFHVDEAAAKASLLGGLCASGWHTAAVFMKLNVAYSRKTAEAFVAAGNPAPRAGPSPGFRELRWPRPVFAGDTVTYTHTVTGKRPSESRPGWGLVEGRTEGVNQNGEPVISFISAWFCATD